MAMAVIGRGNAACIERSFGDLVSAARLAARKGVRSGVHPARAGDALRFAGAAPPSARRRGRCRRLDSVPRAKATQGGDSGRGSGEAGGSAGVRDADRPMCCSAAHDRRAGSTARRGCRPWPAGPHEEGDRQENDSRVTGSAGAHDGLGQAQPRRIRQATHGASSPGARRTDATPSACGPGAECLGAQ
jgi:hypothetical protein